MNTSSIRNGHSISIPEGSAEFQNTPEAAAATLPQVGEFHGMPLAESEPNPHPTAIPQENIEHRPPRIGQLCRQVANMPRMLFNSIPLFMRTSTRERMIVERRDFEERNLNEANRFRLHNEFNAVLEAYDAVIALPSYGYRLAADAAYTNLRTAREAFINGALNARRNRISTSNAKGTVEWIHRVTEHTRADDVAQTDDAVPGRAGRVEIPEATAVHDLPTADEIVEVTNADIAQDATTSRVEVEPNIIDLNNEATVAEAFYTGSEWQIRREASQGTSHVAPG